MTTASLDQHRVDAYLRRLGSPEVRHDHRGLATLQAAHLRAVPFHNLLLLANDGQPYRLQDLGEVVDQAIDGVGGNCDRTTPPFAALLRSVGFDAQLVAATVRARGDHFACVVHLDGHRFLCDVGNGHPYLKPWSLDGERQTQSFNGWRFVFDPHGPQGPTLLRDLGDGHLKTVYVVDPSPRSYADFAPMVNAHYSHEAFGPFLTGLRSVNIGTDVVLTLRDAEYARYTRFGRFVRRVHGRDPIRALLTGRFRLPGDLVDRALSVLARRRPDLLGEEPRWMALGRRTLAFADGVTPPTRDAVPDVLISAATVGRAESVRRLLDSIATDLDRSGYPGRVGVLLVENHEAPAMPLYPRAKVPVHQLHIRDLAGALARSANSGVLPHSDRSPAPIGIAREAQLHALRMHLATPVAGLPHPDRHPMVVWMLDDDVVFEQRGVDGTERRRTSLLFRAARLWATLPQHSVVLGTFTGDPPVPGLDSLGGQLHDLTASVAQLLESGPHARWAPPPPPAAGFDAYYDLSEAAPPPSDAAWPYAPQRAGAPTRAVALELLRDLPRLLDGQQLTRALTWDGEDLPPRSSLRRGGNTLYLDVDALFRWPTPVLATDDGTMTRRADSIWAALANQEDPGAVVEATLPVLHARAGQSTATARNKCSAEATASQTTAQVRGVALARAISTGRAASAEFIARDARVRRQRGILRQRLGALRAILTRLSTWGDPRIDTALECGLEVLDTLDHRATSGVPAVGRPQALDTFIEALPSAVEAWRRIW